MGTLQRRQDTYNGEPDATDMVGGLRKRIRSVRRSFRSETTIAIACQGGGSHAAFTAGVLDELFDGLEESDRVVALSGASGGAVCATAAWYGLTSDGTTPGAVLDAVWSDIAADTGWERWVNQMTLLKTRTNGSPPNPYNSRASDWTRSYLEDILSDHIDFAVFEELASDAPALRISAADVRSGQPTLFADGDVTSASVVASAAVPQLFEAVEVNGRYYWDGFLAGNPPLVDLLIDDTIPPVDELWVIQLTPTESDVPTTSDAIEERTQQLVENLSLTRDRQFVATITDWVESGQLTDAGLTDTTVRTIELHREQADESRLDRRDSFITDLYADGQAEATNFLRERQ